MNMFFEQAKDVLLEKEMMKLIQQFGGEQLQQVQKREESTTSPKQIGEQKINQASGEEEIDWEENFKAMMAGGFGGEVGNQEDEEGLNNQDDEETEKLQRWLTVKESAEPHNNELTQYEIGLGKEEDEDEEKEAADTKIDDLHEEEEIPMNKEQQKELFKKLRSNYLNQIGNQIYFNQEEAAVPSEEDSQKENKSFCSNILITQEQQQQHDIKQVENTESNHNINKPRNLLGDDFIPYTRNMYDQEKRQQNSESEEHEQNRNQFAQQEEQEGEEEEENQEDNEEGEQGEDERGNEDEEIEEGTTEDEPKKNKDQDVLSEVKREYLKTNKWNCKEYRVIYSNGDVYEGEVDNDTGLKDGWGLYTYSNTEKYEGFFQDDIIHGYGRYWFLGGHDYEGDWKEGSKHGVGQLHFANGDRYSGFFVNDNFHGEGEYFYGNGDKFKGTFIKGKKHGQGRFFGKNGRKIIGEWLEDELQHF